MKSDETEDMASEYTMHAKTLQHENGIPTMFGLRRGLRRPILQKMTLLYKQKILPLDRSVRHAVTRLSLGKLFWSTFCKWPSGLMLHYYYLDKWRRHEDVIFLGRGFKSHHPQ